jgi:hypothetical protein
MSYIFQLPSRLGLITTVAVATLIVTYSHQAHAQNLVQNPDFFNGLSGYATSGNVTAANFGGGPTTTPGGTNVGEGDGPTPGNATADAIINQTLTTTANTTYLVTFSYAVQPGITDSMTASFGNTSQTFTSSKCDGSTCLDKASFSATSGKGTTTTLTFDGTEGAFLVSELDVQAGPAPVTGGGILSFGVVIAGLAARHMRRRGLPGGA